jgi:NAD(P)-dependent dehydrogenase (short-subunit alcohol dehydrogenase family)
MNFRGKVALVTGGTSGIGLATARAFARAGARVVLAARGVDRGERAARDIVAEGGEARFVRADVAIEGDVEAMVKGAVSAFGRLDIAVNNAALDPMLRTVADLPRIDVEREIAVNFTGVWLCMKYEIRQMLNQGSPPAKDGFAIVNVSSVNGLGGVPGASIYAASKAAVLGLTRSAALEYAAAGIRVNAVCPGAFETPMLRRAFEHVAPGRPEEAEKMYVSRIPLGRIGDPDEMARAILFLASSDASYVTGHTMVVDGGIRAP